MRVLHVIASMNPAAGGPPNVVLGLAAGMKALGCEAHILSYGPPPSDALTKDLLGAIPNIDSVHFSYLPAPNRAEKLLARQGRSWFAKEAARFDVVHLHGMWEPLVRAVGSESARLSRPFVITPHGMLDPWALAQKSVRKKLAMAISYRQMVNSASCLHFLTDYERDSARPLKITCGSEVIPNGIFLEQIDPLPPRGAFRRTHPELGDAPYALFLGRLHYKKGLDILASAFAQVVKVIPGARLVVAGPDYGARASFESWVRKLNLQSAVRITGPLYGPRKIAALRDCDCFCLPSRQEGFSMAVLEAMACESPVVISPACHFPDVATSGAGYIADLNPEAMAGAIVRLFEDRSAAEQMGKRGRVLVSEQYQWQDVGKKMLDLYRSVLRDETIGVLR